MNGETSSGEIDIDVSKTDWGAFRVARSCGQRGQLSASTVVAREVPRSWSFGRRQTHMTEAAYAVLRHY